MHFIEGSLPKLVWAGNKVALALDMIVWGGGGSGILAPRALLVNFRNVQLSH